MISYGQTQRVSVKLANFARNYYFYRLSLSVSFCTVLRLNRDPPDVSSLGNRSTMQKPPPNPLPLANYSLLCPGWDLPLDICYFPVIFFVSQLFVFSLLSKEIDRLQERLFFLHGYHMAALISR